jgi:hypothetical protein
MIESRRRHEPSKQGRLRILSASFLLLVLSAGPLAAQRATALGVVSRGDRSETRSAAGFSARLALPVLPIVGVAVGYTRLAGRSDVNGTTCDSYFPTYSNCVSESLRNDLVFGTVDYEVFLPVPLFGFEFLAAGGVGVTSVEKATLRGRETGRDVRALAPDNGLFKSLTSINGHHYRFGVGFSPLPGLPLTARLAWQRRVTDLDACATDTYAPFCGEMRSSELLIGLAIGTR